MTPENKKRISIVCLICLVCIFLGLPSFAAEKMTIIAVKSVSIPAYNNALVGIRAYLYKEGIDFDMQDYVLGGKDKDEAVEEIKQSKLHHPKLYITLGTFATKIVQEQVKDVPVVFTMVSEPLRNEITVGGVSLDIDPRLNLNKLKSILPGIKKIGIIYSEKTLALRDTLSELCAQAGFQLIDRKISSAKDFTNMFKDITKGIDCFMMIADPDVYFPKAVEFLLQESLGRKIPVIGLSSIYTKAGALVSFDCDYKDIGAQTAELALEIYRAKLHTSSRIVMPRKVSYSLNLKVAGMLGIRFPTQILREANEVFGQ